MFDSLQVGLASDVRLARNVDGSCKCLEGQLEEDYAG